MLGYFQSRRLRLLTLGAYLVLLAAPTHVVLAGSGLAAIDAFHVGRYHLANGDRDKALDAFNDALRMNPQFVQAYVARGKLLAEMGQYDSALSDLNFALRLQPSHAEGFAYRGFVLLAQGKPQESLPEFDMALRLDPSYARVYYLRGQALRNLGNEASAATSIARALQLDPSIEKLQIVVTAATDDGSLGVRLNAPAGLERTSSIADMSAPPPATISQRAQGRFIRVDQHPILAKLDMPFAPSPNSAQPTSASPRPLPPLTAERIGKTQKSDPNKVSTLPVDQAEELKQAAPVVDESKPEESAEKPSSKAELPTLAKLGNLPTIEPPPALELTPIVEPIPQEPLAAEAKPTVEAVPAPPTVVIDEPKMPALTPAVESAPTVEAVSPEPLVAESKPVVETMPAPPTVVVDEPKAPASAPISEPLPPAVENVAQSEPLPTLPVIAPLSTSASAPVAELLPLPELPSQSGPVAKTESLPSVDSVPAPVLPAIVASPPTVVETMPSAAAILNGASVDSVAPKPTPEASRERIARAIASAQQSVTDAPPAIVSDKGIGAPPVEPSVTLPRTTSTVAEATASAGPLPTASAALPAEQDRQDAELCRLRGVEREEEGDPSAALAEYDNSLRLDPSDPQTYCLRGRLYLRANLTLEAAADFERAIQLAPGLAIGYYGRGHARYLQQDFAAAADDFTIVLRLDDQHALALIERGHCRAQLGQTDTAEADRLAALALDPSLARTGPKYGGALPRAPIPTDILMPEETPTAYVSDAPAKVEQTAAAESSAPSAFGNLFVGDRPAAQPIPRPQAAANDGVATATDRNEPIIVSDLVTPPTASEPADVLPSALPSIDRDAVQGEVAQLSNELNRIPGDAGLYLRRAAKQLTLGRAEDAIDDLNAALRIEPTLVDALALRAEAHLAVHRLPAAEADLNELLRLKPNDAALHAQRGNVKLALGLVQEAAIDLTQALTLGDDRAETYCRRGLAYALLGDAERAFSDLSAAIQRNPEDAEAYVCRGRAYAEFNYPAEALADFNRAVELNPKSADAYFERSRLYAARGAFEKSQVDRRRALDLDPTLR